MGFIFFVLDVCDRYGFAVFVGAIIFIVQVDAQYYLRSNLTEGAKQDMQRLQRVNRANAGVTIPTAQNKLLLMTVQRSGLRA